jgi:hypothetical protein
MELFCLFGMLNKGSLLPFAPHHPHPLVSATTEFCINLSSIIVTINPSTNSVVTLFCKLHWCHVVLGGDGNSY